MISQRVCAIIAAVMLAAVLVVSGCRPSETNAANEGPATNEACTDEVECGEAENGEESRTPTPEESYPYQLNADLAKVFLRYGLTDKAIRHFDLAITQQRAQTNNEDAEYWIGLGAALHKAEEKETAVRAYQRALQILEQVLPNAQDIRQHNHIIGRILHVCDVLGLKDKRNEYLAQLKADNDNAAQQLALAQELHRAGHNEKAETHFRRALELTEENPAEKAIVQVSYANMLMAQEKFGEVLPLLEEAVAVDAANPETQKSARGLLQSLCEIDGDGHAETRRQARRLLLEVYGSEETEDE